MAAWKPFKCISLYAALPFVGFSAWGNYIKAPTGKSKAPASCKLAVQNQIDARFTFSLEAVPRNFPPCAFIEALVRQLPFHRFRIYRQKQKYFRYKMEIDRCVSEESELNPADTALVLVHLALCRLKAFKWLNYEKMGNFCWCISLKSVFG